MLAKYADPKLKEQEKAAWEKAAVEKYGSTWYKYHFEVFVKWWWADGIWGWAEIRQCLFEFLSEVTTSEPEVLKLGIETYTEQNSDFPDCILYAYHKVKGYEVKTFDRKLNKLLGEWNTSNLFL